MVARWNCHKKISGSNPVTDILTTSVPGFFLIFKIKTKSWSRATSFREMFFNTLPKS